MLRKIEILISRPNEEYEGFTCESNHEHLNFFGFVKEGTGRNEQDYRKSVRVICTDCNRVFLIEKLSLSQIDESDLRSG